MSRAAVIMNCRIIEAWRHSQYPHCTRFRCGCTEGLAELRITSYVRFTRNVLSS